jgi:DNA-binding GntR family transcriptional regulator
VRTTMLGVAAVAHRYQRLDLAGSRARVNVDNDYYLSYNRQRSTVYGRRLRARYFLEIAMSSEHYSLALPPKHTLTEDVTEELRNAIFRGHFVPGQRLSEEQLAQTLGVSRGPIREAFVRLERERLITSQANRRMAVTRLSPRDLEEVYSLRLALERLAVQYAVHYAQAEDFATMEANTDALQEAVARGITEQEAATLDIGFHDLLYRASRHRHVLDAWLSIRSQVYLFLLSRNLANADFRERVIVHGHRDILDALSKRNESRALRSIEDHLRSAYRYILQNYAGDVNTGESSPSEPIGDLALLE